MPDLHDLDDFDQGLPAMDLPPAAEIRRRGDRMRRRRTALVAAGGVLAVALAVGTPMVAFSGSGADDDLQPAPKPSQTDRPRDWVTQVLDFPIEGGFPEPFERPDLFDPALVQACDNVALPGGAFVDEVVVKHTGESEDEAQRWLILYPDQQGAEQMMAEVRDVLRTCRTSVRGGGESLVYDEEPVDLGTEDSYAWTEQFRHGDGLLSDLTYVQVARTGNAIYVESHYGSPGGDEVIASVQQLLTDRSTEPLEHLCVYAADPCDTTLG